MASEADKYLGEAKAALRAGASDRARDALLRILQDKPAHSKALAQLVEVMKLRLGVPPRPFSAALLQRLMRIRTQSGAMAAAADAAGISALNPKNAEAVGQHGAFLLEAGHLEPAHLLLRAALALDPDNAQANVNLVSVYFRQKKYSAVHDHVQRFAARNPDTATAWRLIGMAHAEVDQYAAAAESFGKALALAPDDLDLRQMQGSVLFEMGDSTAALPILESVISVDPLHFEALGTLGSIAYANGDLVASAAYLRRLLRLNPRLGRAYFGLSHTKKFGPNDPDLKMMLHLAKDPTLPASERMSVEFGLAKAMEDLGRDDESFAHLERGNALQRGELDYSTQQQAERFDRIKRGFGNGGASARISGDGPLPIFVLGLMRSGTTLTEQILSSHSQVAGAGELEFLTSFAAPLADRYPLSEDTLTAIREAYLKRLSSRAPGAKYVVDKMPFNFQWIGLICKALPEARIIHTNRDPVAVCWSAYKQHFKAKGLAFTCRMDELTAYHDMYEDLMDFWRSEYPGAFLDLHYEALTEDPRSVVAELLAYCGLPWEDACLSPQQNTRAVRTASAQQVRKGIYTGSSQAWRRWEKYITPITSHFAARSG